MGATHSSQTYAAAAPSRPFEKHGSSRSCFQTAMIIATTIPSRPRPRAGRRRRHRTTTSKHGSMTTLMQLVLLQDWQRVLIRATLFPKEITKFCLLELYQRQWKVLPVHVACALDPPAKVISTLLSVTVGGAAACASAMIPVDQRHKRRLVVLLARRRLQKAGQDHKELLTSTPRSRKGSSSRSLSMVDEMSTTTVVEMKKERDWLHHYSSKTRPILYHQQPSSRSLVSVEQSIGDVFEDDDDDVTTTNCASSVVTNDDNDDDDQDSIKFLDHHGVVLQLSTSGDIVPMAMTLEAQDTSTTTEEDDDDDDCDEVSLDLPTDALLQAAAETKTCLPIHIACLFQAFPCVIQVLLQAHPMSALSACVGMLPIHLVALGWKAQPLLPRQQTMLLSSIMQDTDSTSIQEESRRQWTRLTMQHLLQAVPETAALPSSLHGMTAMEYLEHNATESSKQDCRDVLQQALRRQRSLVPADLSKTTATSEDSAEITEGSSSIEVVAGAISPNDDMQCLATALSSGPPSSQPPLYNLLQQRQWEAAATLIDSDPHLAREWYYGMDDQIWKRLALHVACLCKAPLALIQTLIRAYPLACALPDPHSGCLALHLACRVPRESSEEHVALLRALLEGACTATKHADSKGRLPIHFAVLCQAPYAVIEWLVRCDPTSVFCADSKGQTPLQLAQQSYPMGSAVLGLLELVWM